MRKSYKYGLKGVKFTFKILKSTCFRYFGQWTNKHRNASINRENALEVARGEEGGVMGEMEGGTGFRLRNESVMVYGLENTVNGTVITLYGDRW